MNCGIPANLARTIASYIKVEHNAACILDAQCGAGDALRTFASLWPAATYGLDDPLPEAALRGTTQALRGNLCSVRISHDSFDLVLVRLSADPEALARREPEAFLARAAAVLAPSSVLVVLGEPTAFTPAVIAAISRQLDKDGMVVARPNSFGAEKLVMGRHVHGSSSSEISATAGAIRAALGDPQISVLSVAQSPQWHLHPWRRKQIIFSPLSFTYAEASTFADRYGLWTQPRLQVALGGVGANTVRPTMPLRRGHLGLLVAAGAFDTVEIRYQGRPVLLRGRTYKSVVETTTEAGGKKQTVRREDFTTDAGLLDLSTGSLHLLFANVPAASATTADPGADDGADD